MSSNLNINSNPDLTAPTPQNTPLNQAPISLGLSRPTVPDIEEDNEQEDIGEGKLADLVGRSSGYVENLPDEVKANVEALKGVQEKQNELLKQYKLECFELEKKFLDLTKPLYERRNAIVHGTGQATKEEIEAGEKVSSEDLEEDFTPLPKDVVPSSEGIPEFWLTVLRNHIDIGDLITDRDSGALKHLTEIQIEYLDDSNTSAELKGKRGYRLLFTFSPNEYFENTVLEKTYIYSEKLAYFGDFTYDRAIGTNIRWKEDKDLTKEFEIKKQRNKTTNRTRLVRKAKPADSFFNFFYPQETLDEAALENGDIDAEEFEEIEAKLGLDYQLGEDFKEKIIPHAIDYFTGKALEFDYEDEDDYTDDDDEDDDEEDDDEDSDNDAPPRRRGGAKKGGNEVNPEECKQQ